MKGSGFTAQYFTDNRDLISNRKEHPFRFLGKNYSFMTDHGVFSMKEVDYGSIVLLKACMDYAFNGRLLDLGCGYGPISIILKSEYPDVEVTGVDVNPRAVELADENKALNKVAVEYLVSDGFKELDNKMFETVVTNPPIRTGKKVIYGMFRDAYDHLVKEGQFFAVIRRQQGAESAVKELERIYSNCEVIARDKGYWMLHCIKS